MGIKAVRYEKQGKINLLSNLVKGHEGNFIYRIAIISILVIAAITLILKLWLVSFLLIIICLLTAIYTWFRIKRDIDQDTPGT